MFICLFMLSSLAFQDTQVQTIFVDKIAVKVNDKIMTQRELVMTYKQRRLQYLNSYQGAELDRKLKEAWDESVRDAEEQLLLFQKSVELGIAYSEDDVRNQLTAIKESQGLTDVEFEETVKRETGMNFSEYVSFRVRESSAQAVIGSQVVSRIKIEDSEIAKHYQEHASEYMSPATYRIGEIVFLKGEKDPSAQRMKAMICLDFIKKGGDFAEGAKQYSDSSSKENGGDLGLVEYGDLNNTIESAVEALQVGEQSEILETEFAYFIIKLLEKNPPTPKPIDEVRGDIIQTLRTPRLNSKILSYLEELKSEYLLQTYVKEFPEYLGL